MSGPKRRPGAAKAGRKRLDGERYACGKRRPPAPNPKVVALRRAMLGGEAPSPGALAAAENPLDLMLARGWIDEPLHRAAADYAALHRRAALDGPALRRGDFEKVQRSFDSGPGDSAAMAALRALWAELTPAQARSLFETAVCASWPEWMILRLVGKPVPPQHEACRVRLMEALETVRRALTSRSSRRMPG
jgi:hypothetical protein